MEKKTTSEIYTYYYKEIEQLIKEQFISKINEKDFQKIPQDIFIKIKKQILSEIHENISNEKFQENYTTNNGFLEEINKKIQSYININKKQLVKINNLLEEKCNIEDTRTILSCDFPLEDIIKRLETYVFEKKALLTTNEFSEDGYVCFSNYENVDNALEFIKKMQEFEEN